MLSPLPKRVMLWFVSSLRYARCFSKGHRVLLLDRATQSQTGDCRFVSCAIFVEAIFAFRTDLYVYVSYKNICSQLQLLKTEKFTEEKYISLSGNAGEESSSSSGLNQRWIQSDLLPGNLRS